MFSSFAKSTEIASKRSTYDAPDWVAEIISPGARKTDEVDKLAEYAQAGIPEYWIIDLKKKTVRVYLLPEGGKEYTLAATYTSGQAARSVTNFRLQH